MGYKKHIKYFTNKLLKPFGYEISTIFNFLKPQKNSMFHQFCELPQGAEEYLQPSHPRLKELVEKYSLCSDKVTRPTLWTDMHIKKNDIIYFRGDNAYVWQLRGKNMNFMSYLLTTYYVKSIDTLTLLDTLKEDNYFGNITLTIDNKTISRDLLDSIIEIYFLEKNLKISSCNNLNILDIGAGYGRLAHRMASALPNINTYFCTDAVAVSTFLSEYYLRIRNLEQKTKVIPLDEIETTLKTQKIDIAINIHSFSECSISSIEWWLSLLKENRIRYLMIVPNSLDNGGKLLETNDGNNFQKVIEKHGYELIAKEPKYRDESIQKLAINPTYHYLFEMR
ncbi:MAG: putative sugar O-methyltransferase [Candidatus Latescibacterota bacterium]